MSDVRMTDLDHTGKVILDQIYNRPDPRSYFSTLNRFDYMIPGEAAPIFRKIIDARRKDALTDLVNVLDLGCSYGVNAAILKYGLSMDDLYERYAGNDVAALDRDELIAQDREFFTRHQVDRKLEVTGVDVARHAIDYAVETTVLNGGVTANLETDPVPLDAEEAVGSADIVISTGCIGYVHPPTLEKIMEASDDKAPWMAHFVLRMFSYEPFETLFSKYGYVTEKLPGTSRQRRFASDDEKNQVLENLAELGIDPSGKEADGWYHAEFYLSRPAEAARAMPLGRMFGN